MGVTALQIRQNKSQSQQTLGLDKGTRDALADYCRHRWPTGTAKMAAQAWDLSVAESQGVVAGRTSLTTYDKIKKAGGWPVIFSVEAAVVGHGVDQFLAHLGRQHDTNGKRLAAICSDLWALSDPVDDDGGGVGLHHDEQRVFGRR